MLETSSLAFEANGVTTKATKNGGMPEASEKFPILSTIGSAKTAAIAAPAIIRTAALLYICEGSGSLDSPLSSSISSSVSPASLSKSSKTCMKNGHKLVVTFTNQSCTMTSEFDTLHRSCLGATYHNSTSKPHVERRPSCGTRVSNSLTLQTSGLANPILHFTNTVWPFDLV